MTDQLGCLHGLLTWILGLPSLGLHVRSSILLDASEYFWRQAKNPEAIASITEEALQKTFRNLERRLSFVIHQNENYFEN